MNYTEAKDILKNRESKKLCNNTYLRKREKGIAVQLHQTDIILFKENGDTVLDTGGWKTVTTKDRLNRYLDGFQVWQEKRIWYLSGIEKTYTFADGMTIKANMEVEGEGPNPKQLK